MFVSSKHIDYKIHTMIILRAILSIK